MNNTKSLELIREQVDDFCDKRGWSSHHTLKDLAIGISTEANELLALFRFLPDSVSKDLLSDLEFRQKISDELADVLFFLVRFSSLAGIDLCTSISKKILKIEEKYPESTQK